MKKFTIFLLIFLLFVGFSHVNAQSGGGNLHTVTIVGLNEGCVGDEIILTAVVNGAEGVCPLQWKKNGGYLVGQTGQTYVFTVTDAMSVTSPTEYTVEVSCTDCEMVTSPVHYFQPIPKAIVLVDNYKICEFGAVEVTANVVNYSASQVYRYIWFNDAGVAIDTTYINKRLFKHSECPATNNTFSVKAELLHGTCTSEITNFVITKQGALQTVALTPLDTTICANNLVLYQLGNDANAQFCGAPTITWWVDGYQVLGEGLNYLNASFEEVGTHYVYARLKYPDCDCEYITAKATVTVTPAPTEVVVTGQSLYCGATANVTLAAQAFPYHSGYTYTWFRDGAGIALGNPLYDDNVPAREGAYNYLVLASLNGCSVSSENFPVYVGNNSIIGITAEPTEVCPGETVKLTANVPLGQQNTTYQWYAGGVEILGATAPIHYYTVDTTAVYTFVATQDTCTTNSNGVKVTVIGSGTITVPQQTIAEICQGGQATFRATSGGIVKEYRWVINGLTVEGAKDSVLTYNFNDHGVYVVNVAAVGCGDSHLIPAGTVTVLQAPDQVIITGQSLYCGVTANVNLTAMVSPDYGYYTYSWRKDGLPVGTNSPFLADVDVPAREAAYNYMVKVSLNGCDVWSENFPVYVGNNSTIGITAEPTAICAGDMVKLTANVPLGQQNTTYQWSDNDGVIIGANAPILYQTPSSTQTYTFTATQGTCVATSNSVTVTVTPAPEIAIQPITTTICQGKQITFMVSPANYTYTWTVNGIAQPNATSQFFVYKFDEPGTVIIQVSASTGIGCSSIPETVGTITVVPAPSVVITGTTKVCDLTTPQYLTANINPYTAGVYYQYQWFLDDVPIPNGTSATQLITNIPRAEPYAYRVKIIDPISECDVDSEEHLVKVQELPPFIITATPANICEGSSTFLQGNVEHLGEMVHYQWLLNGSPIQGAIYPMYTFTPNAAGVYTFRLIATSYEDANCTSQSNDVLVTVTAMPDQPSLSIAPDKVCSGNPVTITGDAEGFYTWFKNGVPFATGALSYLIDQPVANNIITNYTYQAIVEKNGCASGLSEAVSVSVHPAISVEIYGAHDVCEQAIGEEQIVISALAHGLQPNVEYRYTFKYQQGYNPALILLGPPSTQPFAYIPYELLANDPAQPYYIYVEVEAVGYGCTAQSDAHEVNIYEKPTVGIFVDNENICFGGTVTATAVVTPAEIPNKPYTYIWSVNGVVIENWNQPTVELNNLFYSNNNISVRIERAYASGSCFGIDEKQVTVTGVPSLNLTQNINGLELPGMCVGGYVNLFAEVVEVAIPNINLEDYKFEWRRDGVQLPWTYNFGTDVLNTPKDSYNYEVRAYLDNNLGCNTEWTAFAPVKVVEQPTVKIAPKDDIYYDLCQGANVEINTILNITDPTIQEGFQYKWNDEQDWNAFSNQIDPRPVVFNDLGKYTFSLKAEFLNPTCLPVKESNELVYNVVSNPRWTDVSINPDEQLCLGQTVKVCAEFTGGVEGTNIGLVQWMYSYNDGSFVNLTGPGKCKEHTPNLAGTYTYKATYEASHPGSGCHVDDYVLPSVAVTGVPTAYFVKDSYAEPSVCGNDPYASTELTIGFEGVAPFTFTIKESNGKVTNYTSPTNEFTFKVSPSATTQYSIESVGDARKCKNESLQDMITVYVTDIEVVNPKVLACESEVDIFLNIKSSQSNVATITFANFTWEQTIKQVGSQYALTVAIPAAVNQGEYDVLINIDGCVYTAVIFVGKVDALSAKFMNDAASTLLCANNPTTASVDLLLHFEGTPPFKYLLVGTDGTSKEITAYKNDEVIRVSPKATTTYYVEWMTDNAVCVPAGFEKPEITVTITNLEFVNNDIQTCNQNIDVEFYLISSLAQNATITIGSQSWTQGVSQGYNSINLDIASLGYGTFDATITIDGCTFGFKVYSNYGSSASSQMIHKRWEGYYEVLVVSNNPDGPYANGGYNFTSFQWFKDGVLIPGATNQYYQDPSGSANGVYTVHLKGIRLSDGATVEFSTCGDEFFTVGTMKVYPVPAQISEPVWIELELTPAELEGAYLDIYDAKAAHVKQQPIVSSKTQIEGFKAQGVYYGKITTGTNEIKVVKFVIVK